LTIYKVTFSNLAEKDMKKLKGQKAEAQAARQILKTNPEVGELRAGTLSGLRSFHFSLKGSGQYRAIYELQDEILVCLVLAVGTRENFYGEAERRLRKIH
jgi:mRNA-degrading endonuclease RelE of RelBE toxin-antitoxin system